MYGHPHKEVIANLKKLGYAVFRTDENNDIGFGDIDLDDAPEMIIIYINRLPTINRINVFLYIKLHINSILVPNKYLIIK